MASRRGQFMPTSLVDSQLVGLEIPVNRGGRHHDPANLDAAIPELAAHIDPAERGLAVGVQVRDARLK